MFAATRGGGGSIPDWDVSGATYSGNSLAVGSQMSGVFSITIAPTGSTLYVGGNTSRGVFQYNLPTPNSLSGASYASKVATISQAIFVNGVQLSADGTVLFVGGFDAIGNSAIYQYTLSTPWDVSTATYASKEFLPGAGFTELNDIWLSPDGTKLFMMSSATDTVVRLDMSTPWDLATAAVASGQTFSVATQETAPYGLTFSPDMKRMFVVGATNRTVYQYALTSAGDLTTASYASKSVSVVTQTGISPEALVFGGNGTRMFVVSDTNNAVYQYNL